MADNFLEKRMEDHRRGLDHGRYSGVPQSKRRKLNIDLEERKFAIIGSLTPLADAIIETVAQAGAKIAFTSENLREGMAKAQRSGALFVPKSSENTSRNLIEAAIKRWGAIDTLLFFGMATSDATATTELTSGAYPVFITDSKEEAALAVTQGMTAIQLSSTPPDLTTVAKFITHICMVNLPTQIILL